MTAGTERHPAAPGNSPTDARAHLKYVPRPDEPPVAGLAGYTARTFAQARLAIPVLGAVVEEWRRAYQEPYVGVTTDGRVRTDVYDTSPVPPADAPPTETVRRTVRALREVCTAEQWDTLTYPLDSPQWRAWSNPEVLIFDNGLRLEEVDPPLRDAVLAVVAAAISEEGYRTVAELMRLNAYLGTLVGLPAIMNAGSYQFAIYGDPAGDEPWGWQFYGHHVALNVLFAGDRMTIGPAFLGAEPDTYADGPQAGMRVLAGRERAGLDLIRSLDPAQLAVARGYDDVEHPDLPPGRVHPADGRHLAGAFSDNRVIPVEGLPGRDLTPAQQDLLLAVCDEYSSLLPDGPRAARRREIARWVDETYLTWMGGIDDEKPFYYRVQSPVIVAEFDHHSGMYLTNTQPARFHIHTTLRLPNGNDYGTLLRTASNRPTDTRRKP